MQGSRGHCRLGLQQCSPFGWSPCSSAPHLALSLLLLARWTGRPAPRPGGSEIESTASSRGTARQWLLTTVHNLKLIEQIKHSSNGSPPCSFGLSATSQQYFFLRTNQPTAISQQYFSLRTNQHQPSATSQTNRLLTSTNQGSNYFLADLFTPLDSTMQHMPLPILHSLSPKDDLGPLMSKTDLFGCAAYMLPRPNPRRHDPVRSSLQLVVATWAGPSCWSSCSSRLWYTGGRAKEGGVPRGCGAPAEEPGRRVLWQPCPIKYHTI
jgi:hypothetical protein